MDDELVALLTATGRKDRAAFHLLYKRTSAKLFGIVVRMLRDRSAAADLLQEIYLRVWQKAGSFDRHSGSAMTWLSAIARHGAIDVIRMRGDVLLAAGTEGEDAMQAIAAPDMPELDPLANDRLSACLRQLDGELQRCVVLAYCWGYSRVELAQITGRPIGTIKARLHRALSSLRTCLEGA